jgi:aminoglycoside phosphotransferase (APT) family kinase protein
MNNISKTPLESGAAQEITKFWLGSQKVIASIEELKDGYFNAAYAIQLTDGFRFVLKIAPMPIVKNLRYERDIMLAEVEAMRLVKRQTDIPIPEIYFFDSQANILPSPYFAMEFVEGIPLHKLREKLSSEEHSNIDQTIGKYLRQMNGLHGNQFGCFAHPEKSGISWADTFENLLSDVLQDGQDAKISLPICKDEYLSIYQRHKDCMDEILEPALVHWDLWDGNIFIDPRSHKINGIIDFERCLWADPLMEANFSGPWLKPEFLKGYGWIQSFTPIQEKRRTLYNIYLFLIMVIECTYRKYPTQDQENWARENLIVETNKLI